MAGRRVVVPAGHPCNGRTIGEQWEIGGTQYSIVPGATPKAAFWWSRVGDQDRWHLEGNVLVE